jgi:hypothetical protein
LFKNVFNYSLLRASEILDGNPSLEIRPQHFTAHQLVPVAARPGAKGGCWLCRHNMSFSLIAGGQLFKE